jgi:3-deoxy-manno-octulosonate cytidylyltransferase (CMP-KDO synthetase)
VGFCRGAETARALAAAAGEGSVILHHVGLYAFRRDRLLDFPGLPPTAGEARERLEQLRALEHGWRIRVLDAAQPAFGIDVREDYDRFLARLQGG